MTVLRFLLGDQLTPALSALEGADRETDIILVVEVADETTYVRHHKKKIAFVLAAMRRFADRLKADGWRVDYVKLDDPLNAGSFTGELVRAIARHSPDRIVTTEAGEHRVIAMQRSWADATGVPVEIREDDRFLCSHARFNRWAEGRNKLLMEDFYREMRRHTGLLMEGDKPAGGRWNLDKDNRKPARSDLFTPQPLHVEPDAETQAVLELVGARFAGHFGELEPFWLGVTQADAEAALDVFMDQALPGFGDAQDAMLQGQSFLFHSVLSPYINIGLLDPLEVCRRAELEWRAGRAPLNAVEGFIRQILGWREYVRGIYFREGADYVGRNALQATRPLPSFYWTGETEMNCLHQCISETRANAYAHHIQRLMLTGNFALIAGIDPQQVHVWYLSVYADAYEWVEAPNTLGMSLYADGGLLASKPYAAGGAYINRMSDYCGGCRYDVRRKTGPEACPFNYLYWNFIRRNEAHIAGNARLGFAVSTWRKMTAEQQADVEASAAAFFGALAKDADAHADRSW